jgi:hypothetical protein
MSVSKVLEEMSNSRGGTSWNAVKVMFLGAIISTITTNVIATIMTV